MVPIATRMLLRQRGRLVVTALGVGVTVALVLFLAAVHEGVKDGATSYVHTTRGDVWLCQKNSNNLLKSSSFLDEELIDEVAAAPGVGRASGLLRVITRAEAGGRATSTLFIFGFDPLTRLGAPARMLAGSSQLKPREIVVDRAFAAAYGLRIGSTLRIQQLPFRVAGISDGTNALVSQYAFMPLADARDLLGVAGIVSFVLATPSPNVTPAALARTLRARFPDDAVYERARFEQNNLDEMEAGVLPVFGAVGVFASLVGAMIVTLMLYSSILERREDYAVLKAVGAGDRFLTLLVVRQSLLGSLAGFALGGILIALATPLLLRAVPQLSLDYRWQAAAAAFAGTLALGAFGAVLPIAVLRRIYPAEVFRA
jgi:putative ABC transport system permease protein